MCILISVFLLILISIIVFIDIIVLFIDNWYHYYFDGKVVLFTFN